MLRTMAIKSAKERMRDYRARMKAKGLKQVSRWVYDTDSPVFQEKLRQDIANLDEEHEKEVLEWCEQVAEWPYDDDKE